MDKTLHIDTKEIAKETYTKVIGDYDTLLTELKGAINTLYCVWNVLTEEGNNTPKMRTLLEDAVYSNIEHLERINTDLQGINDKLWSI